MHSVTVPFANVDMSALENWIFNQSSVVVYGPTIKRSYIQLSSHSSDM